MTTSYRLSSAVLGASALLLSNVVAASDCDRACLTQTLNQYLSAVVMHDASKAPLAANFRSTENAREVKVGEGTWQSVKALGEVQRRYADPTSHQVGYFGIVQEEIGPAIVSLRLKVVDRKVTEAEWILGRKGMALYNPEGLIANPPPATPASAANRTSRKTLIDAANSYFTGIQEGDGKIVKAHPSCYRVENGTWMLGTIPERPLPVKAAEPEPAPPVATENGQPPRPKFGNGITEPRSANQACNSGFERLGARNNGGGGVINRRFFADEEAGIGWGTVIFSRAEGARDSRGQPVKWLYLTEVFRVEQGKIRGLFAAMDYLPPEIKTSGWAEGR